MEETDRLLHDFDVNAIAQVGDAGEADVLDESAAEIFGDCFYQKNEKKREGEDGPDVVDARGDEVVHVDDASGAGSLEEDEFLQRGLGIQHYVEGGLDGERDQTFGDAHDGHEQNAGGERERVRSEITQEAPQLFALGEVCRAVYFFRIQRETLGRGRTALQFQAVDLSM